MKTYSYIFFLFILFCSCSLSKNPQRIEVRKLQKGIIKEDTSFVYSLPYELNKKHLLVQGYFSRLTHKERAALDFKMKKGTKICAARGGVVIRVKEDGNKGGWSITNRPFGNLITIQHNDGSRAGYWHLQKDGVIVNVGDTVKQGQVIALSGNTGYTFFPHLHFIIWKPIGNNQWQQVATRFKTNKGIKYLRPAQFYKSVIE